MNENQNRRLQSNDVDLRIIRGPNCNRSDHLHPLIRCTKRPSTGTATTTTRTTRTATTTTSTVDNSNTITDCNKYCRGRRWSKIKHKHKGPSHMEPTNSVAPLLVSNLLDKL